MNTVTEDKARNSTAIAIAAIGDQKPDDYILHPETHAALLPGAAGPLKRILQRPDVQAIEQNYKAADAKAIAAQHDYRGPATRAMLFSFLSVLLAILLFLPEKHLVPPLVLALLYLLEFGLLALSFLASYKIEHNKPFDVWMRERAQAETKRIELFDTVAAAAEAAKPGEIDALPLQLEYVRRFQLDVQRAYYKNRGRQHQLAANRLAIVRYIAMAGGVLAFIPVVQNFQEANWISASWLTWLDFGTSTTGIAERTYHSAGLAGGALQTLLATHEQQFQDERNAARYLATAGNLDGLSHNPLSEARAAAARGDRDGVMTFVTALHEQIRSEHREWLTSRAIAPNMSLDQLRTWNLLQ